MRFLGTKKVRTAVWLAACMRTDLSLSLQVIQSLIVIDLDDEDKIIKLEDKWNGEDQPTRWGAAALRRLNAKTLPWFVHVKAPREKSH
jgi:hypothetical protein